MPTHKKPEPERFKGPAKYAEYLVARALITVLQRLPIRVAFRLGRMIGWLAWMLMSRRRYITRENLEVVNAWIRQDRKDLFVNSEENEEAVALPNANLPMNIDSQVREVFQRCGANIFSGFAFSRIPMEQTFQHIQIEGMDYLHSALSNGKGVIVLLAHMGPWEALTQLPDMLRRYEVEASFGALYRPLNNHYLDEWYRSLREARGTRLFSRRDGFHKPVDFLRSGGMLGVLADQKIGRGERVPFFGRLAKSNPLPGILQRRSGANMLSVSLMTVGEARWKLSVSQLQFADEVSLRNRESDTRLTNQALERALALSPLDAFWFHQRYSKGLV